MHRDGSHQVPTALLARVFIAQSCFFAHSCGEGSMQAARARANWYVLLSVTLAGCNVVQTTPNGATAGETGPVTDPGLLPASDTAPTISGAPAKSVRVGTTYSFIPLATDSSGIALTFSIKNKPIWASFDPMSGALAGTPAAQDVGRYSDIVISVSDGVVTASLPAFMIDVVQVASGSATLSWLAPTQNTDGSPLMNLAGFRVYYGMSINNLDQMLQLANPGLTTCVLSDLSPATWYFRMKAYSTNGTESAFSNIASKTIQ